MEPLAAPRRLEAEQYRVAPAVRDFPRRRAAREPQLPREEVFQVGEVALWAEGQPTLSTTAVAVQRIPAPAVHMILAAPGVSPAGPPPAAAASLRPARRFCRWR